VERHLSSTFVGVNVRGAAYDRAGWLAYWKNGPLEEFKLGEQNVQPEGPDMKVTYVMQVGGTSHASGSREIRVVSVWQQVKRGWVLTATSLTPVQGN